MEIDALPEAASFKILLAELKQWNSHTNLTAIRDDQGIVEKHFFDSLTVLEAIPSGAKKHIDIGSGAGFPGIPIAIVRPELQVTLIESVQKKVAFLNHIVEKLQLKNVTVINDRAENLGHTKTLREQYDSATGRAVAELRVLVEYTLPFLKIGGIVIAQKTIHIEEIALASNALSILGGTIKARIPVLSAGSAERELIVIEKVHPTPAEYPRKSGTPSKKPL
jgi:16S rRNA (guanine527-N7)-methyltransferase